MALISILKKFKIETAQLEYYPNLVHSCLQGSLAPVSDPPLLDYSDTPRHEGVNTDSTIKVLLPGYIDARKCVEEIIQAMVALAERQPTQQFELTLAGKQDNVLKIPTFGDRGTPENLTIVELNYRLSDGQLALEYFRTHVVLAIYKNHPGSSGVAMNAFAFNKKVIFLSFGTLEEIRKEIGITCRLLSIDVPTISRAIESALFWDGFRYERVSRDSFLSKRSKDIFADTLINL